MKSYIIIIMLFCLSFLSEMANCQPLLTFESDYSLRIVDYGTPRYFLILKNNEPLIVWNLDTEEQFDFPIPWNIMLKDSTLNTMFVPFFEEKKLGMLYYIRNKYGFRVIRYSMFSPDTEPSLYSYSTEEEYYSYQLLVYEKKYCFALNKRDQSFDIRLCKDFTPIISIKEQSFPAPQRLALSRYSNGLFIESYISPPHEVRVWDCEEKHTISLFSGQGHSINPDIEIDNSGELGIFYLPIDLFVTKNRVVKSRYLQVRSLRTGKIQAQCVNDHLGGSKFSPVDSQILLLWNHKTATLWKYATFEDSPGEILSCIKLPSYAPRLNQGKKNNECKNNSIFYGTFSSDGKRVIFITDDLRIYIYSSDTGKLLRCNTIQKSVVNSNNE
jgi:WD40 repeat protein